MVIKNHSAGHQGKRTSCLASAPSLRSWNTGLLLAISEEFPPILAIDITIFAFLITFAVATDLEGLMLLLKQSKQQTRQRVRATRARQIRRSFRLMMKFQSPRISSRLEIFC